MLSRYTKDMTLYISKFLSLQDITQLSYVNTMINRDIQEKLDELKQKAFNHLMYYFYYKERRDGVITLRRRYDSDYKNNVKSLFNFLPELFDFIKAKNITYLDISSLTSYGGYPESAHNILSNEKNRILEILNQLVILIGNNKTLTGCNIGLFQYYIVHTELERMMSMHPTLEYISTEANGATHNFRHPPTTLYRMDDGNCDWRHFKK